MTVDHQVAEFVRLSQEYCGLIEGYALRSRRDLFRAVNALLPRLYTAASELPEPDGEIEEPQARTISHDEWRRLYDGLRRHLAETDAYRTIVDLSVEAKEEEV